jgi:hypothetical protein
MHELEISSKINKNVASELTILMAQHYNIEININISVTEKGDSFG